jgi:hypothetical protein
MHAGVQLTCDDESENLVFAVDTRIPNGNQALSATAFRQNLIEGVSPPVPSWPG